LDPLMYDPLEFTLSHLRQRITATAYMFKIKEESFHILV